MQFTTVRSKEKDYDIYLQSEKLVHSQQEHEKNVFQLFGSGKKRFLAIFEPDKHCCSYLEKDKSGSLLVGDQKMQFTTVRSKEKDYVIYLKSEKLLQLFGERKMWFTASINTKKIGSGKKRFLAILSLTNTVAAIWRKIKVDPCQSETKKCSSQLLGARKKIMSSI